jgi:aspartyl protease family protein
MSQAFNGASGLILIDAEVSGPSGKADARLLLDTGATSTALNPIVLRSVGYDPDAATESVRLITGTTAVTVPRLMVNRLSALSQHKIGLRLLAHTLPTSAGLDGLLGLDFLRNHVLTIDFRVGQISLV